MPAVAVGWYSIACLVLLLCTHSTRLLDKAARQHGQDTTRVVATTLPAYGMVHQPHTQPLPNFIE
jgi:hypothetical protein